MSKTKLKVGDVVIPTKDAVKKGSGSVDEMKEYIGKPSKIREISGIFEPLNLCENGYWWDTRYLKKQEPKLKKGDIVKAPNNYKHRGFVPAMKSQLDVPLHVQAVSKDLIKASIYPKGNNDGKGKYADFWWDIKQMKKQKPVSELKATLAALQLHLIAVIEADAQEHDKKRKKK